MIAGEHQRGMIGYDMGQGKSKSSFYASVRQQQENPDMFGFMNINNQTSKQRIKRLLEENSNQYEKKFAFEKGQYH